MEEQTCAAHQRAGFDLLHCSFSAFPRMIGSQDDNASARGAISSREVLPFWSGDASMGFDFDRKEMNKEPDSGSVLELMEVLLEENLLNERANIDSYRRIAASGKPDDEAALRLVRVVLAVEEEHAEILSTVRDTLRDLKPPV
jgi:hypothetical protein